MHFAKSLLPLLCLLALTGCIDIDYVGQTYEADPARQVLWYNSEMEVPPDTYKIVGRATASCGSDRTNDDVRYALLDEAARRGVDAIQVVKTQLKTVKSTSVNDSGFAQFGSNQRDSMRVGVWTPYDSFGQPTSRNVRDVSVQRFEAQVLFLVKTKRYEEAMKKFEAERRPTIQTVPLEPDPLTPDVGKDPTTLKPPPPEPVKKAPVEVLSKENAVESDLPLDPTIIQTDDKRPIEKAKDL